jgi:hypothetical protein
MSREEEIKESIAHWRMLGLAEAEKAKAGNPAAANRAPLFERTARSLELELETGVPHCVDHLAPLPCKIYEESARKR